MEPGRGHGRCGRQQRLRSLRWRRSDPGDHVLWTDHGHDLGQRRLRPVRRRRHRHRNHDGYAHRCPGRNRRCLRHRVPGESDHHNLGRRHYLRLDPWRQGLWPLRRGRRIHRPAGGCGGRHRPGRRRRGHPRQRRGDHRDARRKRCRRGLCRLRGHCHGRHERGHHCGRPAGNGGGHRRFRRGRGAAHGCRIQRGHRRHVQRRVHPGHVRRRQRLRRSLRGRRGPGRPKRDCRRFFRGKHGRGHPGPGRHPRRRRRQRGHLRHGGRPGRGHRRGRGFGRSHGPVCDRHALRRGHLGRRPGLRHPGRSLGRGGGLDPRQRRQHGDAGDRGRAFWHGGPGNRGEQHHGSGWHGSGGYPVSGGGPCGGRGRSFGRQLGPLPVGGQCLHLRRPDRRRPGHASRQRERDRRRKRGHQRQSHFRPGRGQGLRRRHHRHGQPDQGRRRRAHPGRRQYLFGRHRRAGGHPAGDRNTRFLAIPHLLRGGVRDVAGRHPAPDIPGQRRHDRAACDRGRRRYAAGDRDHQRRRGQ
ncbi:hypothetical protein ASZ90_001045 [hydrocarbon metagenome]|uniref:Uncharacterized protein n=1 Tax=hydrocarbon metagenome TaxID=938273 RepID=A0A0W8G7T2_9ZZZZ